MFLDILCVLLKMISPHILKLFQEVKAVLVTMGSIFCSKVLYKKLGVKILLLFSGILYVILRSETSSKILYCGVTARAKSVGPLQDSSRSSSLFAKIIAKHTALHNTLWSSIAFKHLIHDFEVESSQHVYRNQLGLRMC